MKLMDFFTASKENPAMEPKAVKDKFMTNMRRAMNAFRTFFHIP